MERTKNQLISQLVTARNEGDVQYLIAALSDPEIRGIAAMLLGKMAAADAAPHLRRLLSVEDPRARSSAVKALIRIGDRDSVPALVVMVTADSNAVVRSHAVGAVRRLADPHEAVPALLEALRDRDGGVRVCAAEELGFVGDVTAIEPIEAASVGAHPLRRGGFRRAIRRIRKRAAQAPTAPGL